MSLNPFLVAWQGRSSITAITNPLTNARKRLTDISRSEMNITEGILCELGRRSGERNSLNRLSVPATTARIPGGGESYRSMGVRYFEPQNDLYAKCLECET